MRKRWKWMPVLLLLISASAFAQFAGAGSPLVQTPVPNCNAHQVYLDLTTGNVWAPSGSPCTWTSDAATMLPLTGGTLTGPIIGTSASFSGPSASLAINPSAYNAYGDSNTAYQSGTTCYYQGQNTCYPNRIAEYLGIPLTAINNRAVSGDQACDTSAHAFNYDSPTLAAPQPLRTLMIGTNDAQNEGVGAYEATFNTCDQAVISWLTIPASFKVSASTGTTTGTCATDTSYGSVTGEDCTAVGSTISLSLTTYGGPIYIWPRYIDSDSGSWTYSVDGGGTTTVATALATPMATHNLLTAAPGLIRISGIAAGTHMILFTQTAVGTMPIIAVGTPPSGGLASGYPYLLAATIINQLDDSNQNSVNEYRADIRSNVALLQGDGLKVYLVPVENFVQMTTAAGDAYNTLHVNVNGGAELAQAFFYPIKMLPGIAGTGFSWPTSVANMDANASTNAGGTVPTADSFTPGLNIYTFAGHSWGTALSKTSGGVIYQDSFQVSGNGGWRWGVYPIGTPLSAPSQETYTHTLAPPTQNDYLVTSLTQQTPISGNLMTYSSTLPVDADHNVSIGSSIPGTNQIGPGYNTYTATGHSWGTALMNFSSTLFATDFQTGVNGGWKWCIYPTGTVLSTTSSFTYCATLQEPKSNVSILTHVIITASLTPASVAANTCAAQSATVTGVSVGNHVINQDIVPSFVAGLSLNGVIVTGANVVSMNWCNNTSAAITPPSGTYTFDVEQ